MGHENSDYVLLRSNLHNEMHRTNERLMVLREEKKYTQSRTAAWRWYDELVVPEYFQNRFTYL